MENIYPHSSPAQISQENNPLKNLFSAQAITQKCIQTITFTRNYISSKEARADLEKSMIPLTLRLFHVDK